MSEQKNNSDKPQSGKIIGIHNAIVVDVILAFIAVILEYIRFSIVNGAQSAVVGCFLLIVLFIIITTIQFVADKKLRVTDVDTLKKSLTASGRSQIAIILISPILFYLHYAITSFVPGVVKEHDPRVESILDIVSILLLVTYCIAFFILPIIIKIKMRKIKKELTSSPQKINPKA